jgi:hypothetical protein
MKSDESAGKPTILQINCGARNIIVEHAILWWSTLNGREPRCRQRKMENGRQLTGHVRWRD